MIGKSEKFIICLLLVFMNGLTHAQTTTRVMSVHYRDGAISEVPIALVDSITFDYSINANYMGAIITDSITSNDALQRAYMMASVNWTPLDSIPKIGGGYYSPNVTLQGVPYSSVKEINTFLFQDVSYHTFMTAVHNPKSVLYTENISMHPYHGTNCATYYGAVCSSSVLWALGIDIPYASSVLIDLPDMTRLNNKVIDSLKICDVIWKPGHVQMIYDLEFQSDTLYSVTTFETTGIGSHITKYSKDDFLNIWISQGYVGYRYNKIIYSQEPSFVADWEPIVYNNNLCPSKGDRAVYRVSDTININIFNLNYDKIILTRGSSLVSSEDYSGDLHQYYDLLPGIYSVFLQKNGMNTARVSFEVVETNVSYSWTSNGERIIIHFNSSANPEYAVLCYPSGGSFFYPLSELDKWRGYIIVPKLNETEYYCKVIFRGEYGTIINKPIRIE